MQISIVVAASTNNVIGKENKLLWHLPNDLRFFKNITWGMPVVMGRKTFESLSGKPLPGRLNIIITRQKNWSAPGVVAAGSIQDAIFLAQEHDYKELFIIGGGQIYKEALPLTKKIYLTRVNTEIEGDTFFPELEPGKWTKTFSQHGNADEKHIYSYDFEIWEKAGFHL